MNRRAFVLRGNRAAAFRIAGQNVAIEHRRAECKDEVTAGSVCAG
jgi:hypothetical protein